MNDVIISKQPLAEKGCDPLLVIVFSIRMIERKPAHLVEKRSDLPMVWAAFWWPSHLWGLGVCLESHHSSAAPPWICLHFGSSPSTSTLLRNFSCPLGFLVAPRNSESRFFSAGHTGFLDGTVMDGVPTGSLQPSSPQVSFRFWGHRLTKKLSRHLVESLLTEFCSIAGKK